MRRVTGVAFFVCLLVGRAHAAPFAYVPGSGFSSSTMNVIDLATDTVVANPTIVRFAQGVAINATGAKVYVSSIADQNVSLFSALTNSVSTTFAATAGFPDVTAVAINAAGTRLYGVGVGISVVDLTTNSFITEVTSPDLDNPAGVVVLPNGSKVYATNVFSGAHVVVLDTATNTIVASLPDAGSRGIDVHPNGTRVYAADNQGFPWGVAVIDTATDTLVTKIAYPGNGPLAVRVHPDGTRVYSVGDGFLRVIDTATNTLGASVATTKLHFSIDIDAAGTKLYLPAYEGSVEVYDANTLAFITSIPISGEGFARGCFIAPAPVCGNGVQQAGEQCDDGNLANGDCCSSTCQLETCNDNNVCTIDSCVAPTGCQFAVPSGCKTAAKSLLLLKDKGDDNKDQLIWKWIKGQSTDLADFGTPDTTTDFTLCIYAGTTSVAAATIPSGTPWVPAGSKGFSYGSDTALPDGIVKAILKSSDQNKSKILVKGKGTYLPTLPALDTLALPIEVRLINDTTPACWASKFASGSILKQTAEQLKAKSAP